MPRGKYTGIDSDVTPKSPAQLELKRLVQAIPSIGKQVSTKPEKLRVMPPTDETLMTFGRKAKPEQHKL